MIDTLYKCGVDPSKISQVINAANDGTKEVEKVTPREICNYLRKYRKKNVARKCINVIRYFQQKRAQDDNFFFEIEIDEDNQQEVCFGQMRRFNHLLGYFKHG